MYAILFVLLLIVLAVLAFIFHLEASSMKANRHTNNYILRVTAQEGAQIFNACSKESADQIYTVEDLIHSGYLPLGYAQNTPSGPQWVCQMSSGGVNGKPVILLALNGSFSNLSGMGDLASRNVNIQTEMAWNVAEQIAPQVSAMPNTVVGVVPAKSNILYTLVNQQQYNLSKLINNSYATPMIAGNLISSNPSG